MNKSEEVFTQQLAEEQLRRTAKLKDTTIEMAERLAEARDFMAWSNAHIRTAWIEWQEQSSKSTRDMMETRMAFERETRAVMAAGKDVREFFTSPEYASAHTKLAEMVALLDRFSVLKANGTLDAFADFILKVQCPA